MLDTAAASPQTLHSLLGFLRQFPEVLRQDRMVFRFKGYRGGAAHWKAIDPDGIDLSLPITKRGIWSDAGWRFFEDGFSFRRGALSVRFYYMEGIHDDGDDC